MTVRQLQALMQREEQSLQWELKSGSYIWQPTLKLKVRKGPSKWRGLSLPTVRDRLVLRAILMLLEPLWESTFSPSSFGFRPGRRYGCIPAVKAALGHISSGSTVVAQIDLRRFFDEVDQAMVMRLLEPRVCVKLLDLIWLSLQVHCPGGKGLPQGSPLAPFLANLVLDLFDQEFGSRSLVRYADDINLFSRSMRAGTRAMARATDFLHERLHLPVNQEKSNVLPFQQVTLLGFSITEDLRAVPPAKTSTEHADRLAALRADGRLLYAEDVRRGWSQYYRHGDLQR